MAIDITKLIVVAVRSEDIKTGTREFGTVARSLTELKDWLLEKALYMRVRVYIGSLFSCTGTLWYNGMHCQCPSGKLVKNNLHIKFLIQNFNEKINHLLALYEERIETPSEDSKIKP